MNPVNIERVSRPDTLPCDPQYCSLQNVREPCSRESRSAGIGNTVGDRGRCVHDWEWWQDHGCEIKLQCVCLVARRKALFVQMIAWIGLDTPGDGRRCRNFIIRMEVRYRACSIELSVGRRDLTRKVRRNCKIIEVCHDPQDPEPRDPDGPFMMELSSCLHLSPTA